MRKKPKLLAKYDRRLNETVDHLLTCRIRTNSGVLCPRIDRRPDRQRRAANGHSLRTICADIIAFSRISGNGPGIYTDGNNFDSGRRTGAVLYR